MRLHAALLAAILVLPAAARGEEPKEWRAANNDNCIPLSVIDPTWRTPEDVLTFIRKTHPGARIERDERNHEDMPHVVILSPEGYTFLGYGVFSCRLMRSFINAKRK